MANDACRSLDRKAVIVHILVSFIPQDFWRDTGFALEMPRGEEVN